MATKTQTRTERGTRRKLPAARALIFLLVSAVCCVAGEVRVATAETSATREYELKVAFLYNFTKFVEWPVNSSDKTAEPIVFGIAGKGPHAAELEEVVRNRTVNGRKLVVKTVETPEAAKGVHVLFVAAGEDARLAEWLGAVRGTSTLTVGESAAFAQAGGMINFVLEGDNVRFEVNEDAAEQAGLKVSSQLLKLAKTVRKQK